MPRIRLKAKKQPLDPEAELYENSEKMPTVNQVGFALGISKYHVLRLAEELGDLPIYDTAPPHAYHPTWRVPRETFRVIARYFEVTRRNAELSKTETTREERETELERDQRRWAAIRQRQARRALCGEDSE